MDQNECAEKFHGGSSGVPGKILAKSPQMDPNGKLKLPLINTGWKISPEKEF
jgi:hypothetical protein